MMLKVGELARRTGLTVRTLHHYDSIGLLSPSARSDSGYRLYQRDDIARLHQIQALRRFGMSLADIGIHPVATYAFGDHHSYNRRDVALLQRLARQHEANGFVTTEKDLIKLDVLALGEGIGPVVAPELTVEVENINARFSGMMEAAGVR